MKTTYELEKGPAPTRFTKYAEEALPRWQRLVESNPDEPTVQHFLEQHPAFLPGAHISGESLHHDVAVSQPPLPGVDVRQPDFLWIAWNSDTWFPVLIDLERPSKRLFRNDGVPRAEFTQARDQLSEWRAWFQVPANVEKFREDYGLHDKGLRTMAMQLRMILVFGRRSEFAGDPTLTRKRAGLMAGDEQLMSYDRLCPQPSLRNAITTRARGRGKYKAFAVPPTLELTPFAAQRWLAIEGVSSAIASSPGWSAERRGFVTRRLSYWRAYAQKDEVGWTDVRDRE